MMWLDPIPEVLRPMAVEAFGVGDAVGFLAKASMVDGLDLVIANSAEMKRGGIYETALLHAYITGPTGLYSLKVLASMFRAGDRARFRAAAPLPKKGPFTLFRGVSGVGRRRRPRGLSWTSSFRTAKWFAERQAGVDPVVFRLDVEEPDVIGYSNDREEEEFIVLLSRKHRPSVVA